MAGVGAVDIGYPFDTNDKSIVITCDYQHHLNNSIQAIYPGIDWASTEGTKFKLIAVEEGNLLKGYDPRGALVSVLRSLDGQREWLYVHLSKQVKFGRVSKGEYIGNAGDTGLASGVHLHLGLSVGGKNQWQNPLLYINNESDMTQVEHDTLMSVANTLNRLITNPSTTEIIRYKTSEFDIYVWSAVIDSVVHAYTSTDLKNWNLSMKSGGTYQGISSEIKNDILYQTVVGTDQKPYKRSFNGYKWSEWTLIK